MVISRLRMDSIHDPELAKLVEEASDAYAPSQAELAAEVGVRPLALTTWRTGRNRPTAEHLRALAKALEERGDHLRSLAQRLEARAADQTKLTRRRFPTFHDAAQLLTARMVVAGGEKVVRVIFYGSRAKGTARSPASDWDFMVVLDREIVDVAADERMFKRAALDGSMSFGKVRLDVWPISLDEWETARQLIGHPARAADREGEVLYAR